MLPRVIGQIIVHLVGWTVEGGAMGDGGLAGVGVCMGVGGGGVILLYISNICRITILGHKGGVKF